MNVTFKELHLRNFLSFGNNTTVVRLDKKGSTFVVGENVDDYGANGAGKTTIINALCYACYNKPFDNISLQRLINTTNSAKNTLMEVRLILEKNHDVYEVYRCRGESTNISLTKNGEDITLDSVTENDKLIENIIGISHELFTNVVVFSGNSIPFLLRPVSQQRQQTEELFNITILTEKAAKLKEHIKETESAITIQQAIIKERQTQEALYVKQTRETESRLNRWEDERAQKIKSIKQQLEAFNSVDIAEEKELHQLKSTLKKQESDLDAKIKEAVREKNSLAGEIKKISSELSHLQEDKCPYCLQKYAAGEGKIEEMLATKEEGERLLLELEQNISSLNGELAAVAENISGAAAAVKYSSLSEAVKAEANAATASQQIKDLEAEENPHVEALEALKAQTINAISYDEIDRLKKLLEHQQFMLKLLVDKNSFIRRKIINKTVPFLNKRLSHYTKELGLPHSVKFDDDMSCAVTELGRELDFGNLSSGQKKRVNLSLSLAFRDVLHHLHSKVNLLFIDEIDGSLDTPGVDNVFKLLKQKVRDDGIGMWIISHRPEAVGRFDRTLTVRKENGFSSIVSNDEDE
jgi:DNA repair exonuclease SbcCD ATPase subunit